MAPGTGVSRHVPAILARLRWMREPRIWPNGLRCLWTDAFGVVLFVPLFRLLGEKRYLGEAEWVAAEVDRVLGRRRGGWRRESRADRSLDPRGGPVINGNLAPATGCRDSGWKRGHTGHLVGEGGR